MRTEILPSDEMPAMTADHMRRAIRTAYETYASDDRNALESVIAEEFSFTSPDDNAIDREFDGFVRKLITYMMEDPRTISPSLDLLFLAKAIERIGDHAKNIAEFIIYVVKGADVRHTSMDAIESVVR